jgi:hypothetical protein
MLDFCPFRVQYGRGNGETTMRAILIATTILFSMRGIAAATPPAMGPDTEAWVIKTVADFAVKFAAAPNDMAKGVIRSERGHTLCSPPSQFIPLKGTIRDWTGTVTQLDATGDGRGILSVKIAPAITLQTTNNSFSEAATNTPTLIPARSPLLAAVSKLAVGQKVRFSGNLYPSVQDCMEESSITTEGSMTDPEFLFRFTEVAPID